VVKYFRCAYKILSGTKLWV